MPSTWLISDTHFLHSNIIGYCDRPFSCVQEMDAKLISNWNATVAPQDTVYHLGDVTIIRGGRVQQQKLAQIIGALHGHKRLIMGNHDHFPVDAYLAAGFEKVRGTGRWLNGWLLSHFPVHPDSMGSARGCIHGHIHNKQSPPPVRYDDGKVRPYVNVCVEMTNYKPVNLDAII